MVKKTMNSLFLNYLLQSQDNIEANVEKWTKDFNIAENIDEISETLNEHMVFIMISSVPSVDECEGYPYIIPLLEMFEAWRDKNYGKLSESLKNLYNYEQSERKRAGECRKMFKKRECGHIRY